MVGAGINGDHHGQYFIVASVTAKKLHNVDPGNVSSEVANKKSSLAAKVLRELIVMKNNMLQKFQINK